MKTASALLPPRRRGSGRGLLVVRLPCYNVLVVRGPRVERLLHVAVLSRPVPPGHVCILAAFLQKVGVGWIN
jgi:hypothetical protein